MYVEALLKRVEAPLERSEADFEIADTKLQVVYPIGQRSNPRAQQFQADFFSLIGNP